VLAACSQLIELIPERMPRQQWQDSASWPTRRCGYVPSVHGHVLKLSMPWQAKGQLRAIGTALHLKQRFGAGYQVIITIACARRCTRAV